MKNIKYLVMLVAGVAFLAGCSDVNELSTQNKGKTKPTVTLTKGEVTDAKFTFTVAASSEAAQYAYAVFELTKDDEGELIEKETPLAHDIVVDEVSGTEQSGAFNVSDGASQTIEFECDSATNYQIFAAAITSTGLLGEVVKLDVFVPDTIIPAAATFSASGNTATVTFSENVFVSKTGGGSATVRYIQWGIGNLMEAVEIPVENITTAGKVATLVCPKPANGAGYIVSYTAGLFEDASGNLAKGITSGYSGGKYVNIGWNDKNVDFPIEASYFVPQPEDANYNDPAATIEFAFPFDVYDAELKNAIQIIYNEDEGISYLNTTYTLESDKRTVKVALPRVPTASFDVQVAAGAFYDVWANETAAFTVAPNALRYLNSSLRLKEGTYVIAFTSEVDGEDWEFDMSVTRYDNTYYQLTPGSVGWLGWGLAYPVLLGTADADTKTISFDGTDLFNGVVQTENAGFGYGYYTTNNGTQFIGFFGGGDNGTEPIVITFDDEGYLTSISQVFLAVFNISDNSYVRMMDMMPSGVMTYAAAAGAPKATFAPKGSNATLIGGSKGIGVLKR